MIIQGAETGGAVHPPRSRKRTFVPLLMASCAIVAQLVPSGAPGYRFLALESTSSVFPTVVPSTAWKPDVWGRGETLYFVLVDSPGWATLSDDIHDVRDAVEEAMRTWEGVGSADIAWEIEETMPDADFRELHDSGEHFITTQPGGTSITTTMFERMSDGLWYRQRTWISMAEEHVADPYFFRYAMLHELGHVLGLDHASVYARGDRPQHIPHGVLSSSWRFDPVMSYGRAGQDRYRDYHAMLTPDDRVGASLLRPRDRWLESTGNIRGTVLLEGGAGAGLVHVMATRLRANGTLGESVGAFTNVLGEFVIAGLEPGEYALLVRSLEIQRAHPDLLPWVNTGIRDTLWAVPVTVRAGQRAGPVTIRVYPGDERAAL